MNLHSAVVNPFANKYLAACSCGWIGEVREKRAQALRDKDSHTYRELGYRGDL